MPAAESQPEAKQRPSREQQAWLEVGKTDMPRWLSVTLTFGFVALLVVVPVAQVFYEASSDEGGYRADDIFAIGPAAAGKWGSKDGSAFAKLLSANAEALRQINGYESALEDASFLTHTLLGPVTLAQARYLGAGNEEAYLGRDGWLFFRQDFDHVTGPGFLEPARLKARAAAGDETTAPPQPDPRLAIVQFRDQLQARGIELIVMPTPVKPTVHPEMLRQAYAATTQPVQNASFAQFIDDLEAAGVHVYDPAPDLRAWALGSGQPVYLRTDTHWNAAVASVANRLANRVRGLTPGQPTPAAPIDPSSHAQRVTQPLPPRIQVSNLGDIAQMLDLPDGQTLFAPESVEVFQIADANGEPWQPTRGAPVLLLGDSFTNIYSMDALGWGTHGGLGALLSWQLGQPADVIAINAGGAHAARQALVADLARGNDRLAHTKVVIWQFATRELSFGDWKLLDLPTPEAGADDPEQTPQLATGQVIATAVIVDKKPPPKPGSVPYRDAVIAIRVKDLQPDDATAAAGANLPAEALIYTWGMRDNKLVDQPWAVGEPVRMKLRPWGEAGAEFGSFNREELDDPDTLFMDAYWAQIIE